MKDLVTAQDLLSHLNLMSTPCFDLYTRIKKGMDPKLVNPHSLCASSNLRDCLVAMSALIWNPICIPKAMTGPLSLLHLLWRLPMSHPIGLPILLTVLVLVLLELLSTAFSCQSLCVCPYQAPKRVPCPGHPTGTLLVVLSLVRPAQR
jgi:hypothetical protein